MYTPVAIFVYDRPQHLTALLDSLVGCDGIENTPVVVFCDGAKTPNHDAMVESVRRVVDEKPWQERCKSVTVYKSEKNIGLAGSIISGVSQILETFDRVIVLEDDLLLAPGFLQFMNQALRQYEDNFSVYSISGYSFGRELVSHSGVIKDSYFLYRNSSWGWATWRSRWIKADWLIPNLPDLLSDRSFRKSFNRGGSDMSSMLLDWYNGRNNSWAIRWSFAHFVNNAVSAAPVESLVYNNGHDGTGENCRNTVLYSTKLWSKRCGFNLTEFVYVDVKVERKFYYFYSLRFRALKKILSIVLFWRSFAGISRT